MKTKVFLTIALIILIGFRYVQAIPITIQIEAVVDTVEDSGNYLGGQVDVCDVITGYYIYDSTTPDTNPSIYIGSYEHSSAPYGINLYVGGFVFKTDPDNVDFVVSVGNAGGAYSNDNYLILSYSNLPLINGTLVDRISWQFDDSTGSAISSDVLPITPPVLTDWQSIVGLRLIGDQQNMFTVDATVTLATPEPTTVLFLIFGTIFFRKRG
jgi:hypothetical protein